MASRLIGTSQSQIPSGPITNSELAVEWLENIFKPHTRPSTPSHWRLLIIDDHHSYTSQSFCDVLWSHRIIPFLLPPHAAHVIQPPGVSIFGPMTSTYRGLVSSAAESVGATIDKAQFGSFYGGKGRTIVALNRCRYHPRACRAVTGSEGTGKAAKRTRKPPGGGGGGGGGGSTSCGCSL